jgi:hypothetical protein
MRTPVKKKTRKNGGWNGVKKWNQKNHCEQQLEWRENWKK